MSRITGWINKIRRAEPFFLMCIVSLVYVLVIITAITYSNKEKDENAIYQVVCRNATALTYAGDFQRAYFAGDHLETNRGAYFPGPYESCEIVRRGGSGERR